MLGEIRKTGMAYYVVILFFIILIYIWEIYVAFKILTYLISPFYPFGNVNTIERFISFFTLYQIVIFFTLKLYDDIQKSSLNSVKSYYKLAILILSSFPEKSPERINHKNTLKKDIKNKIKDPLFYNKKDIYYENLEKYLEEDKLFEIKEQLIKINNSLHRLESKFRYSFGLRVMIGLINFLNKDK